MEKSKNAITKGKDMNSTTQFLINLENKILLNTKELQAVLGCGRASAIKIGTCAQARVEIGRRVLWSYAKVNKYIKEISM